MMPGDWMREAVRYTAGAVRMNPPAIRGAGPTDHQDVTLVWSPDGEKGRVKGRLASAGIAVLGEAASMYPTTGAMVHGMLVRSADAELLMQIVFDSSAK